MVSKAAANHFVIIELKGRIWTTAAGRIRTRIQSYHQNQCNFTLHQNFSLLIGYEFSLDFNQPNSIISLVRAENILYNQVFYQKYNALQFQLQQPMLRTLRLNPNLKATLFLFKVKHGNQGLGLRNESLDFGGFSQFASNSPTFN